MLPGGLFLKVYPPEQHPDSLAAQKDTPSANTGTEWLWEEGWEFWYTEVDDASFDVRKLAPALEAAHRSAMQG